MSRFFAFGNLRRAGQSVLASRRGSYSSYGVPSRVELHQRSPKIYSGHWHFGRGRASFSLYNGKPRFFSNVSAASATSSTTQRAQTAWKTLLRKYSSTSQTVPPLVRMAQAFSLAVTQSHLLVPGILAFTCGQFALTQRVSADGDPFRSKDTLYMRAQDGHAYMSSLVLSVVEFVILLLRAIYLSILLSPSIVMAPFADTFGPSFRKAWLRVVHRTLEKAGPAFIKWGQWAATRPDLFPRDLCTKLSELHTKAPEHSFAFTKKTIEKAFGRKLSEIFEIFEEKPVASGSIAQVHRATIRHRYPGQNTKPMVVAVKVRHPGVGDSIRRDFVIMDVFARISTLIPTVKWLRLDESVQQFAVFMLSQVDLAREAAHLSRFIYNFRRWKDVSFPKPVYPLVHPAVLVETYEQGESVAHYVDGLEGHERLKSALAHIGTHALLKMLLVDNFIHADMHPGNILVRVPQNKSRKRLFKAKPHVIFLDVGMTAELSGSDRVNLLEFFKAVARRDGRTAAECALRLSRQQNCPDPEAFIKEVEESFTFWGTPEGDLVHPAECMEQLLEKVRRHRVNIDGNVCTVMVTTLVLEGWQRKLDPRYDVMQTLQTLLLRADWAKSLSYTIDGLMAP
uniref:ABC1 atypical kinase-like domain-containing protein n=2 Tax=Kalanchoe fedtschenkoi TaxID=63787 RepID=A0A7N1A439_KALFE